MAYLKSFTGTTLLRIENNTFKEFSGQTKYYLKDDRVTDFYGKTLFVIDGEIIKDFYGNPKSLHRLEVHQNNEEIKDFCRSNGIAFDFCKVRIFQAEVAELFV